MAKICQAKDSFKGGINGIKLWLCQRSIQIFKNVGRVIKW